MKMPELKDGISKLIDEYHERNAEPPRPHMGCSILGHYCDRWLWLSFRWAVQPKFPGRVLRLFRRGQNEEATIVSDLRAIGIDIRNTNAAQSRVDLGCHVSGSIDGIIESGVPEAPAKRHIAEFKTHSKKSFDDLEKQGVKISKPQHYAQMQLYMHGTKISRALYVAVCKDDDRIYTERVRYEKDTAESLLARGHKIATDDRLPPPISTDPTWYQCRFCDAHSFCHGSRITNHVNCRTCAHSTAMQDGAWRCEKHSADGIPVEFQRQGCEGHVIHPDLVPWKMAESDNEWEAAYIIDGVHVRNGEAGEGVYSSAEIIANSGLCAIGDDIVSKLRDVFDARIEG